MRGRSSASVELNKSFSHPARARASYMNGMTAERTIVAPSSGLCSSENRFWLSVKCLAGAGWKRKLVFISGIQRELARVVYSETDVLVGVPSSFGLLVRGYIYTFYH